MFKSGKLSKKQCNRANLIMSVLKDDPWSRLRRISVLTGIPKSTVFDYLKYLKKKYNFRGVWSSK